MKILNVLCLLLVAACATHESYSIVTDKYWSNLINTSRGTHTNLLKVVEKENPHLYRQIVNDSNDPHLLSFWGKSYNFDSGAKKQIIDDEMINDLQDQFKIQNDNKIVHAGITHTYGYLFSDLVTPYGFKRKRWILPTLNYGFSLSGNSLSPEAMEGGLLSNVTFFAGMIAFKEEQDRTDVSHLKNVSSELRSLDYSKFPTEVLEEELSSSVYTIRTTLLRLPFKKADEENDYLLIYSVYNRKARKEILITMFPIKKDAYFKLANGEMGPNQPVTIRYNAYLEGLMDQKLLGTKKFIK